MLFKRILNLFIIMINVYFLNQFDSLCCISVYLAKSRFEKERNSRVEEFRSFYDRRVRTVRKFPTAVSATFNESRSHKSRSASHYSSRNVSLPHRPVIKFALRSSFSDVTRSSFDTARDLFSRRPSRRNCQRVCFARRTTSFHVVVL